MKWFVIGGVVLGFAIGYFFGEPKLGLMIGAFFGIVSGHIKDNGWGGHNDADANAGRGGATFGDTGWSDSGGSSDGGGDGGD